MVKSPLGPGRGKTRPAIVYSHVLLLLLALRLLASIPSVFTDVSRVVAVGDLHGGFENFVTVLKGTRLIDDNLHWTGGRAHLVQTGDIMDRGPSAKRIMDLLIRLEREALEAGGKVHVLIGNHEELNMIGSALDTPGYVTLDQFMSFLPDDYALKKQEELIARKRAQNPTGSEMVTVSMKEIDDYWTELMNKDAEAREMYVTGFRQNYGPWMATLNAVIKINDTVFVHGGLSVDLAARPLEEINDGLRSDFQNILQGNMEFEPKILYNRSGPLWYRDLAVKDERLIRAEVDTILANLKARHMVIAHSTIIGSDVPVERLGGRIWLIDTGIAPGYGSRMSALIIEDNRFTPWRVSRGN